jgi:predicted nucleotidyltransferase
MEKPVEVNANQVNASELGAGALTSILGALTQVSDEMEMRFFLIGALARDVVLEHVHGIELPLTTQDVDVAVAVENWHVYEKLCRRLTDEHGFTEEPQKQRLRSPEGTPLDLVPFGGVAREGGTVQFPPEGSPELTVLGFEEVQEAALPVRFSGGPVAWVASIEGLALLKLIAWDERPTGRPQDAQDLCLLLQHFYDAKLSVITERHADLFDVENFSKPKASARALGREMGTLLHTEELEELVLSVLERETADVHRSQLARATGAPGCYPQLDTRFACLEAFLLGIEESL